jgi:hypothetical protein
MPTTGVNDLKILNINSQHIYIYEEKSFKTRKGVLSHQRDRAGTRVTYI